MRLVPGLCCVFTLLGESRKVSSISVGFLLRFQNQKTVVLLLLSETQEMVPLAFVATAFCLKALEVAHLILRQVWRMFLYSQCTIMLLCPQFSVCCSTHDSPFISLPTIHHVFLYPQCTIDVFFIDWERPRGKIVTSSDAQQQQKGDETPVSVWRTYFAANEFNEIQSRRKFNPVFQVSEAANTSIYTHLYYMRR